jgi:FkbH-like protein
MEEAIRNIDALLTEPDAEALFQAILRRPLGNDQFRKGLVDRGVTLHELLVQLRGCDEFRSRMQDELELSKLEPRDPTWFRVPQDLVVTPTKIRRVLIVGSCLSQRLAHWMKLMPAPCESDLYLIGLNLPDYPARPIPDYDFQIVQLPLRAVLPDTSFARLGQTDCDGHEQLFARAVDLVRLYLGTSMQWTRACGILTFVLPFIVPQQNLVGRLMPRYDLRNPVYFVERLNESLAGETANYLNAHFFDSNEIIATHGRRYVQEDMLAQFNHGAFLDDFDIGHDNDRLETAAKATDLYETGVGRVFYAIWQELLSAYRTVHQTDAVKMVVIDLDDTLWRGIIAERDVEGLPTSEGWPLAFWETLAFLKRRGILLAIISKNDESMISRVWDRILRGNLKLEDFAIYRINWRPKAENMAEILAHVNLLPDNVIYIDDNPAERASITAAFPSIRALGGTPLTWRRTLLWSAETQLPSVTDESAVRTQMVRAQVAREEQRQSLTRADFLASLNVRVNMWRLEGTAAVRFQRVLELINKTNQFNTTGRRWTFDEFGAAIAEGIQFYVFDVADSYTAYGLVGVLVVNGSSIQQFVMSCRVMGLGVEQAAIAQIVAILRSRGIGTIFAAMIQTDRNLPCRDVYATCGFSAIEGGWQRAVAPVLTIPEHVALTMSETADETIPP